MLNSSIHDIMEIEISELSTYQRKKLEQKMTRSNKKLPLFIAKNLIGNTHDQHHIIKKLETRCVYEVNTTSHQKILLDFIMDFYPNTKLSVLIRLCRTFLCHDVAEYLQQILTGLFSEEENFAYETGTRFFPRHLSQPK